MSITSSPIEIQSNFILNIPGENLEKTNIAFTVKKIIQNFLYERKHLIENEYKKLGRNKTYHPDELLSLVVLGTINKITSYRGLVEWRKENSETCCYILNNKTPSSSTIGRFYKEHELLIDELSDYIVKMGIDLDLIGFNHVAIDGTILKANAFNYRLIRIDEIKYLENLIKGFLYEENNETILFKIQKYFLMNELDENNEILIEDIKNSLKNEAIKLLIESIRSMDSTHSILIFLAYLKDNYDGKHTISVTDPECRWMKDKQGNTGLNYNYQVAVDDKYDFIVGQRLVNEPTDHYQLIPMIETVKMSLGKHPDYYTADNGYLTDEAVEYLYKHNINAIMPDKYESRRSKIKKDIGKFSKASFEYDWSNDTYICPMKKILEFKNIRNLNGVPNRVYSTLECKNCDCLQECTKSRVKEIFDLANPLRIKMREVYNSDLGRQIYSKRFHTGETYFGILKHSRNFPGIKRKGIKKAGIELTLQTIAHNIKIIHKQRILP
jgi:transposase